MEKNELHTISFTLNRQPRTFAVTPETTLLEVIRDEANLKGTKRGCDSGHCGACTVIMDGVAVNSCCVLAVQAEGTDITTIEGLAVNNEPTDLQRAFVSENAVQCGFCTPGMIMAAEALLRHNPDPSDDEIDLALSGNLCRCTGYVNIRNAVRTAAKGRLASSEEGGDTDEA